MADLNIVTETIWLVLTEKYRPLGQLGGSAG